MNVYMHLINILQLQTHLTSMTVLKFLKNKKMFQNDASYVTLNKKIIMLYKPK